MKLKLIAIIALLSGALMYSQSSEVDSLDELTPEMGKNIIKTNVTAYAFRNINLTYERVINKKFSVSATYTFIPKGKVPYVESFLKGEDLGDIKHIDMSYNSFTLEPRIYLNKRGFGRGFYLAPYYRFSKIDMSNYRYEFTTEIVVGGVPFEQKIPVDMSGNISANSFGLMIGNQWILGAKQNWVIDFSIIGGHYGFSNGDLVASSKGLKLSPQEQADLQEELNKLDVPLVKIHATANENGATAKLDGPWAGLRFGLSVGYRF
ncbi:MAG: hypothetical protein ABS44_08260 [Chryseobacterium sp. SCN 40-13]|nr:MAG: hypothetical protein ABS44_08260 [Chryseobacterium sp. SCN 40-13]